MAKSADVKKNCPRARGERVGILRSWGVMGADGWKKRESKNGDASLEVLEVISEKAGWIKEAELRRGSFIPLRREAETRKKNSYTERPK